MPEPQSALTLTPIGAIVVLDLGFPISYNTYRGKKDGWISKRGIVWRDLTIESIWHQCGGKPQPLVGRVAIYWETWMPADKRRRDRDNYTGKHCLDVLVKAGVIGDDHSESVWEEHKLRRPNWGPGKVVATVVEI